MSNNDKGDEHNKKTRDEYEGIFNDATVADFLRETSAKVELPLTAQDPDAFNRFVDEQLRAVRMTWIAAEGYMQQLVVLVNGDQERIFTPDDDETVGQFVMRMQREAVAMEAHWVFIARRAQVATLGDATDEDVDIDVTDPVEWQKAVAAGIVRTGLTWYAERRVGDERYHRHGQMQDEGGTLGELHEGAPNQAMPLFASILDR